MSVQSLIDELEKRFSAERLATGEAALRRYGPCTTGYTVGIAGAIRLRTSEEVAEVLRMASLAGVPVYPVSTGRNWGYGSANPPAPGCLILDLSEMNRILGFDAELGVVTVEPGVTQGMLRDFLRAGGHTFLVPVTGAGPTCSLLGNALERGYGVTPWADHFSAVTSLEAVLPDGRIYRSALAQMGGGRIDRLFKWGIGAYVDGLFTQSGFGVVTAMSIALARQPESVCAGFVSLKDGERFGALVAQVREIIASHPGVVGGINLMNQHRVLSMAAPYPRDAIGPDGLITPERIADMGRRHQAPAWTGFITLYGTKRVVAAARRDIRRAIRPVAGPVLFFSTRGASRLAGIARRFAGVLPAGIVSKTAMLEKSLELVNGAPNETAMPLAYWRSGKTLPQGMPADPARDGCGLLWYAPLVPMTAADATRYVAMVREVTTKHGMEPLITLTSLSDRVFDSTVPLVFELDNAAQRAAAHACYEELLERGQALGYLPYRVGVRSMPWLMRQAPDYWEFIGRIKAALDPAGLMSPGRYSRTEKNDTAAKPDSNEA
ncbi:FAD-binding oxidoreductase [Niveibacterium sp. SC-1]|uniref:FAD-binding oxidoreductase n=1 Tax=Niveibacterium sp. SC-1 TaxID=3135646 RepID=UPI00311F21B6